MSHLLTDPHDHYTACQHPWFAVSLRKQGFDLSLLLCWKMWVWARWDFPCSRNFTALVGGVVILVLGDSVHCLCVMRCFAPQGMDLRCDLYNSFSLWGKSRLSPALPVGFFPSLHHHFPHPLQPSPHHLRQEKLSERFNTLPTLSKFPHPWGHLENAQVGTAGGGTAGNSWQMHSNIPSSSLFTPEFSPAALPHHSFYFIASSFSFSSRKLEIFSILLYFNCSSPQILSQPL